MARRVIRFKKKSKYAAKQDRKAEELRASGDKPELKITPHSTVEDGSLPLQDPNKQSHSCCAIFWRPGVETGSVELLGFEYTYLKDGRKNWRFPVETGKENESRETTLANLIPDEIAKIDEGKGPDLVEFELDNKGAPLAVIPGRGDPKKGGGTHYKIFYLGRIVKGEIRDHEIEDRDRPEKEGDPVPPGELLGPLDYYEAIALFDLMVRERSLRNHQMMLVTALSFLCRTDRAIYSYYQDFLTDHSDLLYRP